MRMFQKGKPFMDVPVDATDIPVFSESTLYEALGKDDARFVLGVAEEYDHVINALGPKAVKAILDVKPKLVQRLGVGDEVVSSLADARDERELWREEQNPSEIRLDDDAAHQAWEMLYDEYRRYYDPEKSMNRDSLRALNALTEALGTWEQEQLEKERKRLPKKLEAQKLYREYQDADKELRQKRQEATEALLAARGKNKPEMAKALKLHAEVVKLEEKVEELRWKRPKNYYRDDE